MRDDIVLALAEGRVVGEALSCVEEHLHDCPDCRSVVAETAKFFQDDSESEAPSALEGPLLEPGTRVSRYVVTNVLGSGAAGVVYRAHDPQLRRKIALKLLRPEHSLRPEVATLETRLLREARAMAQLSHPNVVTVFDVGRFAGQIFLVMELVEGETLASWLSREHPWRERLRVLVEAAHGLSAAHAVHIVHRDFKPANVLVGADGRVRVTDFGLARPCNLAALQAPRQAHAGDFASSEPGPLFSGVTATEAGGIAGTPAFMAPEQFLRGDTDARTDQFSFCVALYQALYGSSPFLGRSFEELRDAVIHGRLESPPPSAAEVPTKVFAVLKRGLSVDPAARFPHMAALVEQLFAAARDTPPRISRRVASAALSAGALALAGWFALRTLEGPAVPRATLQLPAQPETRSGHAAAPHAAGSARPGPVLQPADLTLARVEASSPDSAPVHAPRIASAKPRPKPRRKSARGPVDAPPPARVRYEDQLKDPF